MGTAAKSDAEVSGTIAFSVPFTSSSTYKQGDEVASPTTLVGNFPAGLSVYPTGYVSAQCKGHVSVFVEARPRTDWWPQQWLFPDVNLQITLKSAVDGGITKTAVYTFNGNKIGVGDGRILKNDGYTALKDAGWVFPDDTLRFHATLSGKSLTMSWDKMQEKNQYAVMYKQMKFADMRIVAGEEGKELQCHRAVLAACSPVFDRMLATSMQEGAEQRLVLRHVCPKAVSALLEYIYVRNCSEATRSDGQVLQDLLALADQYQLPDLVEQCARCMVELLDTSNAYSVLAYLRTYGEKPNVREHFREAKRRVQQDESLFDAAVFRQASKSSAEDVDGSQPSKRSRTDPA